jgi:hypothetical protein
MSECLLKPSVVSVCAGVELEDGSAYNGPRDRNHVVTQGSAFRLTPHVSDSAVEPTRAVSTPNDVSGHRIRTPPPPPHDGVQRRAESPPTNISRCWSADGAVMHSCSYVDASSRTQEKGI